MFIDYVEIEIAAGNGGPGCMSFHREKYMPKGGPDGGDGGKGGDVIAVTDTNLTTLLDFRYHRKYKAENGRPGSGALKTGKSGKDTVLRLPVGTLITDLETGQIIVDLDQPDSRVIIAKGGIGGRGNNHFKSPTNQVPRKTQPGRPGGLLKISLEIKLLADVGLVGLPNAGKSTILARFSDARPKIADYPFTTLIPNLGIVGLHDYKSCVMADIPGLIEGAAVGKGLGHQFLKHIQRTGMLIFVIDVNEPDIPAVLETLRSELKQFDDNLANRSSLVAITKIDTITESDLKEVSSKLPDDYLYLSAVAGLGADEFINRVEVCLDQQRAK